MMKDGFGKQIMEGKSRGLGYSGICFDCEGFIHKHNGANSITGGSSQRQLCCGDALPGTISSSLQATKIPQSVLKSLLSQRHASKLRCFEVLTKAAL